MKKTIAAVVMVIGFCTCTLAQYKNVPSLKDETSMTYYLVHPLHEIESTSKDVSSVISVDAAAKKINAVSATVDVMTFNSGNSNRDSHAMEVIDAISFPEASFTSTSVSSRNDSVWVTGKLTFHGVTREITMNSQTQWSAHKVTIHAGFSISLTAFQIERPALLLVPVHDDLRFSLTTAYAL